MISREAGLPIDSNSIRKEIHRTEVTPLENAVSNGQELPLRYDLKIIFAAKPAAFSNGVNSHESSFISTENLSQVFNYSPQGRCAGDLYKRST